MSSELACTYAALMLQDDDLSITSEKISTILKSANVDVEPFWPSLFAKALEGVDVKSLMTNIGSGVGVGSAPAAGGGGGGGASGGDAAPAAEEKKKEEKRVESEEEDEDLGFGLFD